MMYRLATMHCRQDKHTCRPTCKR